MVFGSGESENEHWYHHTKTEKKWVNMYIFVTLVSLLAFANLIRARAPQTESCYHHQCSVVADLLYIRGFMWIKHVDFHLDAVLNGWMNEWVVEWMFYGYISTRSQMLLSIFILREYACIYTAHAMSLCILSCWYVYSIHWMWFWFMGCKYTHIGWNTTKKPIQNTLVQHAD